MKEIFLAILTISLLTNCNNSQTKSVDKNDRLELVPEPDKELREDYEKQQELNKSKCAFVDPDTSVVGIKIRNAESTINILGKQTKLEGDSTHVFYSSDKKQKLGLTVHPGDYYSQVSIFNISYSDNPKQNFRQINSAEFQTEKGIRLGISKREIIEKLGICYMAKDSISLSYRLELPNDSRTKLLKNNNTPIYYAGRRSNTCGDNFVAGKSAVTVDDFAAVLDDRRMFSTTHVLATSRSRLRTFGPFPSVWLG